MPEEEDDDELEEAMREGDDNKARKISHKAE